MTISVSKKIELIKLSQEYSVPLGEDSATVIIEHTVSSVTVNGESAQATVTMTVSGIASPLTKTYGFPYSKTGGDVISQAEAHLLTLPEFAGGVKS